jgi:hypothetical protein
MRMLPHASGTDKGQNEGTRASRQRFKLRMKKRCDIKSMTRQLHRADVSGIPQSGDPQPSGFETRYVVRIHPVVAEVTRFNSVDPIDEAQLGTGEKPDRMEVVKGRGAARTARKRALERCDDEISGIRLILRGVRVRESQDVARMLYQSILKPASGARERNTVRASVFDTEQHAPGAFVGARRRCPQCIETR